MRKAHAAVIEAFKSGRDVRGGAKVRVQATGKTIVRFWTSRGVLYSYQMPIAVKIRDHVVLVPYDTAPTATTRAHVRAVELAIGGAERREITTGDTLVAHDALLERDGK